MLFKRVRLSADRKAGLYLEFRSLEMFHGFHLTLDEEDEINVIDLFDVPIK